MPESIPQFLSDHPIALLFVILGLGYLIGKFKIAGFEVGAISGVLFVGLFFGHYQFEMSATLQSLGFMLFIFSVGFQAGPRFFGVLRQDGLRYLSLAVVIGGTGYLVALVAAKIIGLDLGAAAGLLAGGLTSSPTLAAAQEAVRQGQVPIPEGYTADAVMTNVTTAYAITYIFGLVGLILIVRLMPRFLGIDMRAEAAKLASMQEAGLEDKTIELGNVVARAYRVAHSEFTGIPLGKLRDRLPGRSSLEKLRRDGEWITITDDTCLEIGDEIGLVGYVDRFLEAHSRIGPELDDPALIESKIESCRIVVTQKSVKGLRVDPAVAVRKFGCFVAQYKRMGVEVPLCGEVALMPGDVLHVTGPPSRLDELGKHLGHVERDIEETDLVTLSLGIALGAFIGAITVEIGGVPIGLGAAGGLLATGLCIGYLRALHPTFGRLPDAARWLFMEPAC
ncbi:MAG: aspartate-alanine antiporter-like transporter [Planctomycetota bacterium]|jgi:putative transport protein